ncbi:MAG: choice-of-anchor D domain-containing protein, partial [Bdellovibrionota bacterium]
TVTNTGTLTARFVEDANLLAAPFRYKGSAYPGTGGTCGTEILAAATCTIVLEFAPTASGLSSGSWGLGFVTGGSVGAVGLALQGSSGNALLVITDTPLYTFGTTYTGATTNRTFTITNTGSYNATVITDLGGLSLPFLYAGGSYPGTAGTCAATLASSASCTIVVQFAPTLPQTDTDTIELSYYDGEQTQTLNLDLTGPGRGAVIEATIGTTFDFGLVAKNSINEGTITLHNTGNFAAASITITDNLATPFRYKGFAYPGTGGSCSTSIAAGATCTMVVEYAPTGAGTAIINSSDNTILRYNPGSGIFVTTTLTAQGRAGLGTLTYSSGAWGTVANGSTTERSITVTNGGTFPSTAFVVNTALSTPFSFAGGSYPGVGSSPGTCGTNLAPGGTCTLRLAFNPIVTGVYSDTLILQYFNGQSTLTSNMAASGTSAVAVLTITDFPSYDYGSVSYNQNNVSRTFTVTNTGGFAASTMSMTGLAAPFTRTGGTCSTSLAAGATCTHIIRFTPTAIATSPDTMNISYNDGQAVQALNQDVVGTGINVAPVANAQARSFVADSVGNSITLTSSDPNGNARTYELLTLPANGTLSVAVGPLGGPTFTYTPDAAYHGSDSFTFRVNDGMLDSPAATFTITIP